MKKTPPPRLTLIEESEDDRNKERDEVEPMVEQLPLEKWLTRTGHKVATMELLFTVEIALEGSEKAGPNHLN